MRVGDISEGHLLVAPPPAPPPQAGRTMICLFIVRKKSTQKYTTSTGQNTGMSKILKKVMNTATVAATIKRCLG